MTTPDNGAGTLFPEPDMEQLVLRVLVERIRVQCSKMLTPDALQHLKLDTHSVADGIAFALSRNILAVGPIHNHAVPQDWWQHFKLRWFPAWARRRWPVEYNFLVSSYDRVCPHHDFPHPGKHIEFLTFDMPRMLLPGTDENELNNLRELVRVLTRERELAQQQTHAARSQLDQVREMETDATQLLDKIQELLREEW